MNPARFSSRKVRPKKLQVPPEIELDAEQSPVKGLIKNVTAHILYSLETSFQDLIKSILWEERSSAAGRVIKSHPL